MSPIKLICATAAALIVAPVASASTTFFDNFDSYVGGGSGIYPDSKTNWDGASTWTITDGTVDLVANGNWGLTCLGNAGKCIDIDGSSKDSGFMFTELNLDPGKYVISFWLAGNGRSAKRGPDDVTVEVDGLFDANFNLAYDANWSEYTDTFTVAQGSTQTLSFTSTSGDNVGAMLDSVSIRAVPEPATWLMMLAGFAMTGFALKRRKGVAATA